MTQVEIFLVLAFIVTAVWLIFCMRNVEKCMDEICDLWTAIRGAMELLDALYDGHEVLQKKRLRIQDSSRTPPDAREDDLK